MQRTFAFSATLALALAASTSAHADETTDVRVSASGAISAMTGNSARVRAMLRREREERRAPQARCVDGALSRVDAALRSGRDEQRFVEAALVHGEVAIARRALVALLNYREATRAAVIDADACLSIVDVLPRDGTVVKVVVDPTLPSDRSVFSK